MALTFRVELVWQGDDVDGKGGSTTSSIYLTKDGRVVLQGRPISEQERAALDLPRDVALISVDRTLIKAVKEMR